MHMMNMAGVLRIVFLVVGMVIALVCYWLLFEACAPARVERARLNYERRPVRTFLLGLLVSAPVVVVTVVLLTAPVRPLKALGAVAMMLLILTGLLGSAGFARLIGERLSSPLDACQPWRRVLRGGFVLSVSFALPFIGWVLALPLTLISGVGAAISRAPESSPSPPAPVATNETGLAGA